MFTGLQSSLRGNSEIVSLGEVAVGVGVGYYGIAWKWWSPCGNGSRAVGWCWRAMEWNRCKFFDK